MGKGQPPDELWLAWHCKHWGMTPSEVMETPAGLLDKMMEAENTYNTFSEFKTLRPNTVADWVNANPGKWSIITKTNGW